jgi:uncharacterized protein
VVKVKVMEVDAARARIGLSMRMGDTPAAADKQSSGTRPQNRSDNFSSKRSFGEQQPARTGSLGSLLMKAGVKK